MLPNHDVDMLSVVNMMDNGNQMCKKVKVWQLLRMDNAMKVHLCKGNIMVVGYSFPLRVDVMRVTSRMGNVKGLGRIPGPMVVDTMANGKMGNKQVVTASHLASFIHPAIHSFIHSSIYPLPFINPYP